MWRPHRDHRRPDLTGAFLDGTLVRVRLGPRRALTSYPPKASCEILGMGRPPLMGVIRRKLALVGPRRQRPVECLFDTGASASFIRPELVRKLGVSTASLPKPLRIHLGKGSTRVSQLAAVMIRLNGVTLADAAYVMPGLTEEYVVGAEFLERYDIRLDPKRRRVVLPDRRRLRLILV